MGKFQIEISLTILAILVLSGCESSFRAHELQQGSGAQNINPPPPPPAGPPIGDPPTGDPPSTDILSYCPMTMAPVPGDFQGRQVLRVCPTGDTRPGCQYNSIQAALNAAPNGSRVEVVKGSSDYTACAVIPAAMENVEVVGVCGRPRLRDSACQSKGFFVNNGKNMTFTHLEISGVEISSGEGGNGAAIRDQSKGGLTVRYCHFHHNQNGILGGMGDVTLEWSKFEANGSAEDPGYTHNIYMSAEVTHLIVRNSLLLRARYEGNNFKSRAQKMTFECSVSASLDGEDSREMDISQGGDVVIRNSVIQQGPESANSNMIGFAMEAGNTSSRNAVQSLTIENTLMINDRGSGSFIDYNAFNGFKLNLRDLTVVGAGGVKKNLNGGAETVTETNTTTFGNRSAAGLPAATTNHMDLPKPAGCPSFNYF